MKTLLWPECIESASLARVSVLIKFRKGVRWASPIVFVPRTLVRTWGTRPVAFGIRYVLSMERLQTRIGVGTNNRANGLPARPTEETLKETPLR